MQKPTVWIAATWGVGREGGGTDLLISNQFKSNVSIVLECARKPTTTTGLIIDDGRPIEW